MRKMILALALLGALAAVALQPVKASSSKPDCCVGCSLLHARCALLPIAG